MVSKLKTKVSVTGVRLCGEPWTDAAVPHPQTWDKPAAILPLNPELISPKIQLKICQLFCVVILMAQQLVLHKFMLYLWAGWATTKTCTTSIHKRMCEHNCWTRDGCNLECTCYPCTVLTKEIHELNN